MSQEWAVFDRSGHLACLPICGETQSSVAVEGGAKVPRDRLWMRRDSDCSSLLSDARLRAGMLDIESLWRAANGETLTADELATRAGAEDSLSQLSVLQAVLDNPAYFRRKDGVFSPVSAQILEKVRGSLQRRAEEAAAENAIGMKISDSGEIPPEIMQARGALLAGDDKNNAVFRAAKKAAGGERYIPEWLVKIGACADAGECWQQMFARRWNPRPANPDSDSDSDSESDSAAESESSVAATLPEAEAKRAFSVDEFGTFEVDDAFSARALPGGDVVAGIHIAIPALDLSLCRGGAYHSRRLTSVYFPGNVKHPMLSPSCIERFSLREGGMRPALSLYCRFDRANGILGEMRTRAEMVRIEKNFRPEDFTNGAPKGFGEEYEILRDFAALLPPLPGGARTEFRISISPPKVVAVDRPHVGMLVEKMMRLVNSEWARQIYGGGGLFRAGGMLTPRADPSHIYAWLSSPLRRYPDLANQRLLLSLLNLAPKPSVHWRTLAREYSSQQTRARHFQDLMERHWILRALDELPKDAELIARRRDKNKIRLRDYPISGALIGEPRRPKMQMDEEIVVRLREVDYFIQRARFERVSRAESESESRS